MTDNHNTVPNLNELNTLADQLHGLSATAQKAHDRFWAAGLDAAEQDANNWPADIRHALRDILVNDASGQPFAWVTLGHPGTAFTDRPGVTVRPLYGQAQPTYSPDNHWLELAFPEQSILPDEPEPEINEPADFARAALYKLAGVGTLQRELLTIRWRGVVEEEVVDSTFDGPRTWTKRSAVDRAAISYRQKLDGGVAPLLPDNPVQIDANMTQELAKLLPAVETALLTATTTNEPLVVEYSNRAWEEGQDNIPPIVCQIAA